MNKKKRKPSEASQIAEVLKAKPASTNEEVIAELAANGVDVKGWQVNKVREKLGTQRADSGAAPETEAETAPATASALAASESEISPIVDELKRENVTPQRKRQPIASAPAVGPKYYDAPENHSGVYFPK